MSPLPGPPVVIGVPGLPGVVSPGHTGPVVGPRLTSHHQVGGGQTEGGRHPEPHLTATAGQPGGGERSPVAAENVGETTLGLHWSAAISSPFSPWGQH